MSSTAQEASPTSNIQLIVDALADYANITGIDLSTNTFAAALEQSNSPEAILQSLQGRANAFKEYRDGNRALMSCLRPSVRVIKAFSEILGEAASLLPFPLANALFAGIDILLAAANGVTSSYDALIEFFESLGNFLKRLEIYMMDPPTPIMTDIIVKTMIELLSVLGLATKQVKQGRFKKFAKKLFGDGEIEAILMRLDRLTEDEARMTVSQTLGVVHGLVANMKVIMEDDKGSTDSIRQDLVSLHHVLNEKNKMKRDQLRQDVQHWLSPPDPSTNHNFVRKARHKGTAAWFFESNTSTEWKKKGSLLWIHGKPGAGKSTLLSAIIQDIESMQAAGLATMAYYYFDFRDVKKQDCYGLLSSLISQLSFESDSCYSVLSQLYLGHARGMRNADVDALKRCMTDMLSLPGQAPIYIIIDALDECPNFPGRPSAREEVLELIEELVDLRLPNVHLCVASRPEMDIRIVLEPLTSLKICLHDESGQKQDIIDYIKSVVRSERRMRRWKEEDKRLAIDNLSDRADGAFRWVVCQVDRLCRTFPAAIRSVLEDLPKTLDETYSRTLLGIDREKQECVQRLLQCLTISIRPLRVEELAEILAIQFGRTELPTYSAAWLPGTAEEAVMSACSSLITVVDRGSHQEVHFSHFSVKEYLTSERLATAEERLSCYHILPEPAHMLLAKACLTVLLQLDDKIDRNTTGHFPLVLYAARHWVDHAQFRNVSSHIQEVIERLFDPAKPYFAAWVWLYDIDCHSIEPTSTIHPTRPEAAPLYYAALCGFRGLVEHLIVADSQDVNNRGGSYTTALHAASVKGYLDVASLLLEHGAVADARDNDNCTSLHWGSQQGHLDVVRILVEHGINVNARDHSNWTPLHGASRYGHLEGVQFLLEHGADAHASDQGGWTPLQWPSHNGDPEIVRVLLEHGADANTRDNSNWMPLHCASQQGHLEVVQVLLEHGANPNSLDDSNQTPLDLASRAGHFGLVELIKNRANIDVRNNEGRTPIEKVVVSGHCDVMQLTSLLVVALVVFSAWILGHLV